MAYGREKGFRLGGPRGGKSTSMTNKRPGFKLQSDMKLHEQPGGKMAPKAARKKV